MFFRDEVVRENPQVFARSGQPFFEEGIRVWNQEKERKRMQRLHEQKEVQELLEKFWPWNKPTKPRGIGNLRLEEIFPDDEMRKAKRAVGLLNLGRPGGGAPNANEFGKKLVRTREDPILRFQWGKDLRQTVDNTMRYRKNKCEQEEYRKQLDKIVGEKKKLRDKEKDESLRLDRASFMKTPPWGKPGPGGVVWRPPKDIGLNFLKSMGWSDVHTLDKLENEHGAYKSKVCKGPAGQGKTRGSVAIRNGKENDKNFVNIKPYRLSPLQERKGHGGGDLVNVIARKRYQPMIPLSTTDVTKDQKDEDGYNKWKDESNSYLQELAKQMQYKNQKIKETRTKEMKSIRRHFVTLDSFWGRPGHGAPKSSTKMGHIERMLYPQMIPVGVA